MARSRLATIERERDFNDGHNISVANYSQHYMLKYTQPVIANVEFVVPDNKMPSELSTNILAE